MLDAANLYMLYGIAFAEVWDRAAHRRDPHGLTPAQMVKAWLFWPFGIFVVVVGWGRAIAEGLRRRRDR